MKRYLLFALIVMLATIPRCKKHEIAWNGKIVFITGSVLINKQQAVLDQVILPGTEIVTSANSICDIIFNEKNIIRITEDTNLVLTLSDTQKNIELKSGAVANVLKKLSKADKALFKIKTPTAIAAIRGTLFFIKVEDQTKTYICDCNGIIQVSDINGGNSRIVEANHHKGMIFARTDSGFSIRDAGMIYHTDADMNDIAKKIGVVVDWLKIDRNNQ